MSEESKLPKRIDLTGDNPTFTANGTTYTVEGGLSIERYCELQILEKELAYGFTAKGIFDKLQKVWNNQNKLKFAENAVIVNDLMRGIARVMERQPVMLKICALFMNTEDEDRRTITQAQIDKKLADWKAENLDMRDFFTVAFNSVNGFLEIYAKVTRIISDLEKGETEEDQP